VALLTLADVVALHEAAMRRMGWVPAPLRDEGALESAIMRPRHAAHYEGADIIRQAALLAIGISQAQAFLDGNKRTAAAALLVFLYREGWAFDGDPIALGRWIETVAAASDREAAAATFETWLRGQIVRSPEAGAPPAG